MSKMAALSDGIYLIMSGARYGHTNFGLATDLNLTWVLYDRYKPVGLRKDCLRLILPKRSDPAQRC